MSAQTRKLVSLAKSGSAEAFGELYELYYKEMYCYACCVTGDEGRAEDAVSDAVLSAFESISSLKKDDSFKSWLFSILRISCQKQYVSGEKAKSVIYIDDESNPALGLSSSMDLELSAEVKEAVGSLSGEEREIVLLSILGNYKSHEIAEMLDVNPSTVRSKLKRALKKLRDYLDGEENNGKEGRR